MKKNIKLLLGVLVLVLVGCSNNDRFPNVKSKTEVLLYNKNSKNIVLYNKDKHKIIEENKDEDFIQYEFNDLESNFYTSKHTINNDFKIIEVTKDRVKTLYESKEQGLYPIAYQNNENMYFAKTTFDSDKKEIADERVICAYNSKTNQLEELEVTKGFEVSSGVVINDILYLGVYFKDEDKHELYQMNVNEKNTLDLIGSDFEIKGLHNNNGKLWISDSNNIYEYQNKNEDFKSSKFSYFYNNNLIQINEKSDSSLELTVTNLETKNVDHTYESVIEVRLVEGKLYIYTLEDVIEL